MQKSISQSLLLLTILFSASVFAEQFDCGTIVEIRGGGWPYSDAASCDCSDHLSRKYRVAELPDFTLVAVCNYQEIEYAADNVVALGQLYFKGKATVNGELKHNEYASGTNLLFFVKKQGLHKQFTRSLSTMNFADEPAALRRFTPPKLSDISPCWKADATLTVTRLLVVLGDNDEAGDWLLNYNVHRIDPYVACEPES